MRLVNLFCLILSSLNCCGFRHVANTVRFIRISTEFRINKRKTRREAEKWCDGKAGLKRFHCGVYKHTSEFAFVLGRICAARKELGCTEVCVSLLHTAGFPRVQTCGREGEMGTVSFPLSSFQNPVHCLNLQRYLESLQTLHLFGFVSFYLQPEQKSKREKNMFDSCISRRFLHRHKLRYSC